MIGRITLLHEVRSRESTVESHRFKTTIRHCMKTLRKSNMTQSDIKKEYNYRNELYKIDIIIQTVHIYKQVRSRDVQILPLFLFIENQKNKHARLVQTRTDEDNSIIIAMHTIFLRKTSQSLQTIQLTGDHLSTESLQYKSRK